jgi:acyl-CoA thioester hydrolase
LSAHDPIARDRSAAEPGAEASTAGEEFRIRMRWRDIDGLGHVNNAVVLTYLEEGRDRFLESLGINRSQYVVAHCSVDFTREITLDSGSVSFGCELTRIGNSSFGTKETLRDGSGQTAVEAEFALVMWDEEGAGSRPLTAEERTAFERSGKDSK